MQGKCDAIVPATDGTGNNKAWPSWLQQDWWMAWTAPQGGWGGCGGGSECVCFGWVGLRGRDYVTTATVQEIRSNGLDLWGYFRGGCYLVNMKEERLGGSRGQRKWNCRDGNCHSATTCGSGAIRRAVN